MVHIHSVYAPPRNVTEYEGLVIERPMVRGAAHLWVHPLHMAKETWLYKSMELILHPSVLISFAQFSSRQHTGTMA